MILLYITFHQLILLPPSNPLKTPTKIETTGAFAQRGNVYAVQMYCYLWDLNHPNNLS